MGERYAPRPNKQRTTASLLIERIVVEIVGCCHIAGVHQNATRLLAPQNFQLVFVVIFTKLHTSIQVSQLLKCILLNTFFDC